jgi:transcriptional regulator with XRE-family HTH domain
MKDLLDRLRKYLADEESRYVYADSVTNSFITGQIKALREARGLTQDQLAELVGTKQSGISRWQSTGYAGCKVDTLRKFARAFGVRLKISFEEFSTLPTDIGGFTSERLTPQEFGKDPIFGSALRVSPLPRDEELCARQVPRPGIERFQMLPNGNENTTGGASDYRDTSSRRVPPQAETRAAELSGVA